MNPHFCLMTNDVETTSILNHKLRDETAEYLLSQGMPRLLDLYETFDVKATFFFTGYVARLKPKLVRMVADKGHEIGSHGLTHDVNQAFDLLPLKTQVDHLRQSKKILEDICGQTVFSFRAPAARVNYDVTNALEDAGYRIDSSVSSQRLDMMLSFGSLKKMNWILAPRLPYFTDRNNIFRAGNSTVLEIPISAFGLPYIGSSMRVLPSVNKIIRWLLFWETKVNNRPVVFLTHPNEFIDEDSEGGKIQRRGTNWLSYLLGDVIRHKLKIKNLGEKALPLFRKEIEFFKKKDFCFVTCQEFYHYYEKHIDHNKAPL